MIYKDKEPDRLGFWSSIVLMGQAKDLTEEEKKALREKFEAFVENEKKKARVAENKGEKYLREEEWDVVRHTVCYSNIPEKIEHDTMFCFGVQTINGFKGGVVGVAVVTVNGVFLSTIECPHWNRGDCPLKLRIAARNRKVEKREIDF